MELHETQIKEPRIDSFPSTPNSPLIRIDAKEQKEALHLNESQEPRKLTSREKLEKELTDKDPEKIKPEKEKKFKSYSTRLSFSFDKDRNKTVISVLDGETGEIIRQIPPEEAFETISKISPRVGNFFDQII